ncbi:pmt family 4-amino-4-deoxy-l-arabinose transferase [Leptolyngbya sp. Heron Island J]|uniref:ArnT family glycosyltransferase n=1 Tax=Leptolyngbya sp. Heron Island J TaxID=1385935 RepID=UPI0003B9F90E|nr:glycosyltransferase family 39 protein [Leptolyngbya sp. Heron Island J]ESA38270.1 pmt family 4-amino-4-deoxy-l-arabinose transferase [Leptolyngbya sp. Heron Island J]
MTRSQLGLGWLNQSVQTVMQAKQWHPIILLLWMIPLLLVGFFDLENQSLMAHDEGLYARRARVIVDTGDWIHPWATPHHKTPGPYWILAIFIKFLGRHEVAVRLPSVLASIGCILLTYAIGRRLLSPTAALLGSLSLGVAPLWLQYSRLATPDVIFTGLVLFAIWLLLLATAATQHNYPNSNWLYLGAGISLGLTVLIRSALAAVPIACLLPYLIFSGRHHLKQWRLYLGGLLGLLPIVLWLWLGWQRYDMAVINSLLNFPVRQSLTTDRAKSPFFYVINLLGNDFLWAFFALGAVVLLLAKLWRSKQTFHQLAQPQISLLLLYPLSYISLLSFASTKLPHYAIPTYPFLALLTGYAMEQLANAAAKVAIKRLLHAINSLLAFLGGLLTVAACLALTTDSLPSTDDIRLYAPTALGLGIGWLGASGLWFKSHQRQYELINWLGLLLLGHWVSLSLAWGTADLGNINPEMKALLLRADIQPILQTEAIDFSPGLSSKRSTLLRFYTPNLGQKLESLEQVGTNEYLWIENSELPQLTQTYDDLGQIRQTHLVHIQSQ